MDVRPEKGTVEYVTGYAGSNLHRPECVVAHRSGLIITPNWRDDGGISLINKHNHTAHILCKDRQTRPLRPNGITLEADGSVLLAHMGDVDGGIYRLFADGSTEIAVETVNGKPMPPTNFVVKDRLGRIWITVSTRKTPRALDYRADANTGFIAVALPHSTDATIVADGLGYTNECVIDEVRQRLYVNETFGRRLTQFTLNDKFKDHAAGIPSLGSQTTLHNFGIGTYPDGLALDSKGDLWVTSIVSNRIIRISRNAKSNIHFEDSDESHILWAENAYQTNTMGREHLDKARSKELKNISNAAFGGSDLKTLYLGNLLGDQLPYLNMDVAGEPMVHWNVPLGRLADYV